MSSGHQKVQEGEEVQSNNRGENRSQINHTDFNWISPEWNSPLDSVEIRRLVCDPKTLDQY